MAALHLSAEAHTLLKGWYAPGKNTLIRMETIEFVKVNVTSAHYELVIGHAGQKQEFRFATLELLNEALSPLHLVMTDLDEKVNP